MPEGNVIHRLARDLDSRFQNARVHATSPQGRFVQGAAMLDGREVLGFEAYGKHLFGYAQGLLEALHVHLGLFGKVTFSDGEVLPTDTVRLRLQAFQTCGSPTMDLRGPTACEMLNPVEVEKILARLGPDPLRADAVPDRAWKKIKASNRPIGELLLDQSVVAGPGNIYRAEVLFRAGIDPRRPGKRVSLEEWKQIWEDLVILMAQAVESGSIDTVRPEHTPDAMGRPPRVDAHGGEVYVYRRTGQPCLVCGTPVEMFQMGSRRAYACPHCQKR